MRRCQPLLGTFITIDVDFDDINAVQNPEAQHLLTQGVNHAFSQIRQVNALMSVFDPESDIGRINSGAHLAPVCVHLWTRELLAFSLCLYEQSAGAFDIGTGQHLQRAGVRPADTMRRAGSGLACGSLHDLEFLDDTHLASAAPMQLDLGGVAKGFAVDRAVDVLLALGGVSGVVNAGGDLRVFGKRSQAVHVQPPRSGQPLVALGELYDGAVASSSNHAVIDQDASLAGHLIDPRDGSVLPGQDLHVVVAPCCAVADALTKVVAVQAMLEVLVGPWWRAVLSIHGVSASVCLFAVGSAAAGHVRVGWLTRSKRSSGVAQAVVLAVLALSGWMLYYGSESMRDATALLHGFAGLFLLPVFLLHAFGKRRPRSHATSRLY